MMTSIKSKYFVKSLAFILMTSMLLISCNRASKEPSREEMISAIDSMEAQLMGESNMGRYDANTILADSIIDLYVKFADSFTDDSLAPVYLQLAAQVATSINRIDDMSGYYDRVINDYPDYEKLDECYYEKGIALDNAGRKDEARKAYQEFLEEFPDHFLANDIRTAMQLLDMSDKMLIEFLQKQQNN